MRWMRMPLHVVDELINTADDSRYRRCSAGDGESLPGCGRHSDAVGSSSCLGYQSCCCKWRVYPCTLL